MRLALAQMQMGRTLDENLEATEAYLRQAQAADADLVLFPEVQLTPFFPAFRREESPYAEDLGSWCLDFSGKELGSLLGTCRDLGIAASFNLWMRWPDGKAYDTSFTVAPDGTLMGEPARMVHVADAPGFYERGYYTPSPSGFPVYETPWGKIGVVICYDRHFPESIRTCAVKGADLVLVPTANVADEPQDLFQWEMRVQAFQNSCYIAMCNRCGEEKPQSAEHGPCFAGHSLVAGPDGELVGEAEDKESLFVAKIDLAHAAEVRAKRGYLAQRRPDRYFD